MSYNTQSEQMVSELVQKTGKLFDQLLNKTEELTIPSNKQQQASFKLSELKFPANRTYMGSYMQKYQKILSNLSSYQQKTQGKKLEESSFRNLLSKKDRLPIRNYMVNHLKLSEEIAAFLSEQLVIGYECKEAVNYAGCQILKIQNPYANSCKQFIDKIKSLVRPKQEFIKLEQVTKLFSQLQCRQFDQAKQYASRVFAEKSYPLSVIRYIEQQKTISTNVASLNTVLNSTFFKYRSDKQIKSSTETSKAIAELTAEVERRSTMVADFISQLQSTSLIKQYPKITNGASNFNSKLQQIIKVVNSLDEELQIFKKIKFSYQTLLTIEEQQMNKASGITIHGKRKALNLNNELEAQLKQFEYKMENHLKDKICCESKLESLNEQKKYLNDLANKGFGGRYNKEDIDQKMKKRIQKLEEQLKKKQEQLSAVNQTLSGLRKDVQKLNEIPTKNQLIATQQKQIESLRNSLTDQQKKIDQFNNSAGKMKYQIAELEKKKKQMSTVEAGLRHQLAFKVQQLQTQERNSKYWQDQCTQQRQNAKAELQNLKKANMELQYQLRRVPSVLNTEVQPDQYHQLKSKLESLMTQESQNCSKINKYEQQIRKVEDQKQKLVAQTHQLQQLRQDYDQSQATIRKLQIELKKLEQKLPTQRDCYLNTKQNTSAQLSKRDEQITILNQKISTLETEILDSSTQIRRLIETIATKQELLLNQNTSQQQNQAQQIQQLQRELQSQREVSNLKDQSLSKMRQQRQKIQKEKDHIAYQLKNCQEQLQSQGKQSSQAQSERVITLQLQINKISAQIKNLREELQQSKKTIHQLTTDYQKQQAALKEQKQKVQQKELLIKKLESQVAELKQKVLDSEKEIKSFKRQLQSKYTQIEQLKYKQAQNQTLKEEIRNMEDFSNNFKQEAKEKEQEYQKALQKINQKLKKVESQLQGARDSIQKLRAEKKDAQQSHERLQKENLQLQRQITELQQQKSELYRQKEERQRQNVQLDQQLSCLQREFSQKEEQVRQLESRSTPALQLDKLPKDTFSYYQEVAEKLQVSMLDLLVTDRLLSGEMLKKEVQHKHFIINQLQQFEKKQVKQTRLIYKFDRNLYKLTCEQKHKIKINFHEYIDGTVHMLLVVKSIKGYFLAGYNSGEYSDRGPITGPGLIMSLLKNQVFQLFPNTANRRVASRAMVYDAFNLNFGNSELRIKWTDPTRPELYSNFGVNNAYYNNRGEKVDILLGEGDNRETFFEDFQIYEVQYDQEETPINTSNTHSSVIRSSIR